MSTLLPTRALKNPKAHHSSHHALLAQTSRNNFIICVLLAVVCLVVFETQKVINLDIESQKNQPRVLVSSDIPKAIENCVRGTQVWWSEQGQTRRPGLIDGKDRTQSCWVDPVHPDTNEKLMYQETSEQKSTLTLRP